jgi:hypothetical protein
MKGLGFERLALAVVNAERGFGDRAGEHVEAAIDELIAEVALLREDEVVPDREDRRGSEPGSEYRRVSIGGLVVGEWGAPEYSC